MTHPKPRTSRLGSEKDESESSRQSSPECAQSNRQSHNRAHPREVSESLGPQEAREALLLELGVDEFLLLVKHVRYFRLRCRFELVVGMIGRREGRGGEREGSESESGGEIDFLVGAWHEIAGEDALGGGDEVGAGDGDISLDEGLRGGLVRFGVAKEGRGDSALGTRAAGEGAGILLFVGVERSESGGEGVRGGVGRGNSVWLAFGVELLVVAGTLTASPLLFASSGEGFVTSGRMISIGPLDFVFLPILGVAGVVSLLDAGEAVVDGSPRFGVVSVSGPIGFYLLCALAVTIRGGLGGVGGEGYE